ncbi:MAG TPA: zinc-ribbon domain-containing protein [Candidatus Pelethosoma merdigallinarum]|nr:zinc-ribbon domain-containing protein [Candidatus Pelethosoma merdigallinarum]
MKCLKCGYENPNDVQYCLQCGNPLTSPAVNPLGNNVLSQSVTNTSAQNTNSGNPSQAF